MDSYIQLYRSSVLCDVLTDTLEELCAEEKISFDLASRVLDGFDKSCLEALSKRVEAKGSLQVRERRRGVCCALRLAARWGAAAAHWQRWQERPHLLSQC